MDLVHFNQGVAANAVFNRYLAVAKVEDIDGLELLPLFLSVRAAIRAHVLFMKSEHAEDGEAVWQEARRYFDLAGRLIKPKAPMLVAIGGMSGTGKSVLARGLAGLVEPPPSNTAQRVLAQGCSVVLDAAFLQEAERAEPASLARKHGARFVGLFLTADLAARLARIKQRKSDASDATRDVVLMQETFTIGAVDWHMVDASGTPDQSLRSARVVLEPAPGEG
ncbi:AAA family ATPase [Bradyrhizobium sp. CCBAU 051011]|uniref:AAA family ATPase n=1 Tax=Bradyrhizobium sp. CCBAU 051011 TaxID=858422 RepID=UPI001FEF209E|nr:AAA family ATPase [Bradyrhizobium sp. CCBAU 051011]